MVIGITGASGHIGNVLCRLLLEKNFRVKGMYNQDKRPLADLNDNPLFELFQANILDQKNVEKFVSGCDLIINAAAIISIHGDPTGMVFKNGFAVCKNLRVDCQGIAGIYAGSHNSFEKWPPCNGLFKGSN
jgi:nucleoside-diphosphate-sugar epimerase